MTARDRSEFEYRQRLEAEAEARNDAGDHTQEEPQPGQRFENQAVWVDLQIRAAMERGEFDNLPGAGKPIRGLDGAHDPNWWVKQLIEREQISVLPPALALRREDTEFDDALDEWAREADVRREVEDFNRRIIAARRQLQGGPPVITAVRDVDREVDRWAERRRERAQAARHKAELHQTPQRRRPRSRWFHR
jgi:hypothetical protein